MCEDGSQDVHISLAGESASSLHEDNVGLQSSTRYSKLESDGTSVTFSPSNLGLG